MGIRELKIKEYLRKNELAKVSGVRPSSIKYYSEVGLLPYSQEGFKLHRVYNRQEALERLKDIRALKRKGYSIEQIKETFEGNSTMKESSH